MIDFEALKAELQGWTRGTATEEGHVRADEILCEIAADTTLTKEQRLELVALYNKIGKWYA